jgi:hypothetical protein
VYVEVEGPVSNLTHCRQSALTCLLTVWPMFHTEDKAVVYHDAIWMALQEVPNGQE